MAGFLMSWKERLFPQVERREDKQICEGFAKCLVWGAHIWNV